MNTIKFSSIYEMKKETNNVEIYSINKNKNFNYYSNAHMNIYVTKKCNGKCFFCMNKYEKRFGNCIELGDKDYFNNLEKVLINIKNINPRISITGGEPTKSNRIVNLLRLIKKHNYKLRTFSTNGSGLFDLYEDKYIIEHMKENNCINNINVSRMSTDDLLNKEIMGTNITNDLIKRIFMYGKINNMDIRLSCNLLANSVKDLDSILNFVNFYENMGVDTIMFRELINIENKITIDKIFNEIKKDSRFIHLDTLDGMYYIVDIYRYKDKLVKCYKEKNNNIKNVIREFVYYTDGILNNGFNTSEIVKVGNDV